LDYYKYIDMCLTLEIIIPTIFIFIIKFSNLKHINNKLYTLIEILSNKQNEQYNKNFKNK